MNHSKSTVFTVLLSAGIIANSICLPAYGDVPVPGSGTGQSGVTKELRMVYNPHDGKYYLRNTVDNFETFYGASGGAKFDPDIPPGMPNSGPTFEATFSNDSNVFSSIVNSSETEKNIRYQKAAVDAHSNVTKIINFFKSAPFYRNNQEGSGICEGAGMKVLIADYGRYERTANAWGSKNYIGINVITGENGKTLSSCLDVLAHEYTHGMLQFEGLTGSQEETLALHEGIADVFGILARYYIANEYSFNEDGSDENICGLIGKEIYNNNRYMRDAFNPECTTYADYVNNENRSALDGGGLISRAAGLMANGGPNVPAISYGKIARIFYNAINDGYLTTETSLQQFANYALLSSSLLYGVNSQAYRSTKAAFTAVGLLETPPENFNLHANNNTITLTWNATWGSRVGIFRKASEAKAKPVLISQMIYTNRYTFIAYDGSNDYYLAYLDDSGVINSGYSDAKRHERLTSSTPANFRMISKNGLDVRFAWSGTGNRYAIYRKLSGTSDEFELVGQTTSRQMNVNTLNGRCDFRVAVVNDNGTRLSNLSNVVTIEEYLNAPSNFTATNVTPSTVTFAWNRVSSAKRYAIIRTRYGTYDPPQKVVETKNTTYKIPMIPGRYNYQVAVVDLEGNRLSSLSNLISVGR